MPASRGKYSVASATLMSCNGAQCSRYERRRPVITGPGNTLLTCTPSPMPRSENALANAVIAALMVPTAAYGALGNIAELPEVNTTDPLACLSAGHASM